MKSYVPFAQLDQEKFFAIMERLIEKDYTPGENIINQGDKGDFYYIIKSGRVAVIKISKEMKEILLAELAEGAAFGEEALIRDLPRNATIRALETVLALSKRFRLVSRNIC
jgi:CRP-like cAMP-binding protein